MRSVEKGINASKVYIFNGIEFWGTLKSMRAADA
jgi:hypothetical protein